MRATFEQMRAEAYRLLGDAEDELRDAKRPDVECGLHQQRAAWKAKRLIAAAKEALNDAA
jgi:hypothetical protein